ncbi:MAG TPA: DUF420 domain-containing protein [Bacteroidota bacterium]|nr:DUF420 domain-containing protein [Bacteroidota bacterium]
MSVHDMPLLNAALNAASTCWLLAGYLYIRRKSVRKHRLCMISAVLCSAGFFLSYIIYHIQVGSVHFVGQGMIRPIYFSILTSHTVLAAVLPILVAITLARALRARFDRHRRIARWTLPIWLYVSLTGIIVYLLLYQFYPSA